MDLATEMLVVTYEAAVTVELADRPVSCLEAEAARTFERISMELTSLLLRLGH
jgi:hypothetical protein